MQIVELILGAAMRLLGLRGLTLVMSAVLVAGCVPSDLSVTKTGSGSTRISAKSGKPVGLASFFKPNDDCNGRNPGTIKVVSGPAHGATALAHTLDVPTYAKGHPLAKCNSHKIPQIAVFYKSAPGYTGKDVVTVAAKAAGSDESTYFTFYIDVTK